MTQDLAALVAQATPGPWEVRFRRDGSAYISMGGTRVGQQHKQFDLILRAGEGNDEADARLIAMAPDLARTVLEQQAEIEAQAAEIAWLRDAIEKAEQQADYGQIDACRRILSDALQRKARGL